MKDGPSFENKVTHCYTKDKTEINVKFTCYTGIINNKDYKKHTDPGRGRQALNVGWRNKLQQQIEGAIAYVLKYYHWTTINQNNIHEVHIERQIKHCLNENYQGVTTPLSTKGLKVKSIGLFKITERDQPY